MKLKYWVKLKTLICFCFTFSARETVLIGYYVLQYNFIEWEIKHAIDFILQLKENGISSSNDSYDVITFMQALLFKNVN